MRLDPKFAPLLLALLVPASPACIGLDVEDGASRIDGPSAPLLERHVTIAPSKSKRYKVPTAVAEIVASFQQAGVVPAQLWVQSGAHTGNHYEHEAWSEVEAEPEVEGTADATPRTWWVRIYNRGQSPLVGDLTVAPREVPAPLPSDGLPTLSDPVQYENDWCVYADSSPYVRAVKWDNPEVKAALRALGPGWRSTMSYPEWRVPYRLENERAAGLSDDEIRNRTARNYVRVLCGEFRDYPALLHRKLQLIGEAQIYAGPDEMETVDTSQNLFTQITYPAYRKMVDTMETVHAYRQSLVRSEHDKFYYGHDRAPDPNDYDELRHWNRVDHSVPPWTHCEMKYMFEHYMTADAPSADGPSYVAGYEQYKQTCSPEDFEYMYNFRGHKNFKPLWLESNGFIMNSQHARALETARGDRTYYQHPFASRYRLARKTWATYLLWRDEDRQSMIQAGDRGGGPILYLTDEDQDDDGRGDGLLDYRLFSQRGCGDQGLGGSNPDSNCNMVSWDLAYSTPSTGGHAGSWDASWWTRPDMGFMEAFNTFDERMTRINSGLDRHTNWGPTGYYQIAASEPDDTTPRFAGMYSPIVACSYDISASDSFASGDWETTPEFEQNSTKWMFIMRFRTADYYDEDDLREGRTIDFDRNYFNETSMSNDYYHERALDRFGWVPLTDMYANIYFVYGARGEQAPALVDIPTSSSAN